MRPAAVGFHCPDEVAEARRTVRQPRTALGGRIGGRREATMTLIGINVLVFIIMVASGAGFFDSGISKLFAEFALVPDRVGFRNSDGSVTVFQGVAHGDYYRLVTSQFLHFGIVHLGLNMFVLALVGPQLEQVLGRLRFVTLYLLAGIGGGVATYAFGSTSEIAAGASGAIFGLFGAYYAIARRFRADTGPIVLTIVINVVFSLSVPHIDIRAHLGGLVTGAVLGAVLAYAPRERRDAFHLAGFAAMILILAAITAARTAALT
jgi:membrane associated rhomboid family serine protease